MKNLFVLFLLFIISLSCRAQTCFYSSIDSNYNVKCTCKGSILVNGKIDDTSMVELTSIDSDIVITGKIDKDSKVIINAKKGSVTIRQKIDNRANVSITCKGDIIIEGRIDGGAVCDFYTETGKIIVRDKVGKNGTVIKYHSTQVPDWGSSISIVPVSY